MEGRGSFGGRWSRRRGDARAVYGFGYERGKALPARGRIRARRIWRAGLEGLFFDTRRLPSDAIAHGQFFSNIGFDGAGHQGSIYEDT